MSQFAESLGVKGQVSAKRIRRLLGVVIAAALASLALLAPPGLGAGHRGGERVRGRPRGRGVLRRAHGGRLWGRAPDRSCTASAS